MKFFILLCFEQLQLIKYLVKVEEQTNVLSWNFFSKNQLSDGIEDKRYILLKKRVMFNLVRF